MATARTMKRFSAVVLILAAFLAISSASSASTFKREAQISFQSVEVLRVMNGLEDRRFSSFRGLAAIEFSGSRADGATFSGHGLWQFDARCISPLCGGWFAKGSVRFQAWNDADPGITLISGAGKLSTSFFRPEVEDEVLLGFTGDGTLSFRVRSR